jgi:hypothetical protein
MNLDVSVRTAHPTAESFVGCAARTSEESEQ